MIPDQRIGRYISQVLVPEGAGLEVKEVNICQVSDSAYSEETIKEMAQHIMWDKLSERDVRAVSRILVKTVSGPIAGLSHLSRLQRELEALNASKEIISTTLNRETTYASNKI